MNYIALHNRNRGCGGIPHLSRKFATGGSTEANSPLLSVRGLGCKAPLYIAAGTGYYVSVSGGTMHHSRNRELTIFFFIY